MIRNFLFGRAAKRFVIVAPCSFASLLNLYLTFTLCYLSGKILLNLHHISDFIYLTNLTNLIVRF